MKKRILQTAMFTLAAFALLSFDNTTNWVKTGSSPQNYQMGTDIAANTEGAGLATIKSISNSGIGFGALMHQLEPSTFAGKRVKVTGIVKTNGVEDWGGIWLSVNQPVSSQTVRLDNMKHSNYSGSTKGYMMSEIVMDVPVNSTGIAYGSLLKGKGQIFTGRVFFDIVDKNVPLTK